ncbi:MAG: choice-of-anchor Q domain-containing protein [Dokdonella sp.]
MREFHKAAMMFSLALVGGSAQAAVFCVASADELQQALLDAASNGASDSIKVEAGVYTGSSGIAAFSYSTTQNFGLAIVGGYLSLPGQPCVTQTLDSSLTVLNGSGGRQVLRLQGNAATSGNYTVSNVTLRGGRSAQPGAGLSISGSANFAGNVAITRVIFERNVSTGFAGGLNIATAGLINVLNNLFLGNQCNTNSCAMTATVNASDPSVVRAYFGNNTIVGNTCLASAQPSCDIGGMNFGGTARAVFYNNAFAFQSGADLALNNLTTELHNNNIVSLIGSPAAMSGNLAFADPLFVNVLDDNVRPSFASPLRNAGSSSYGLMSTDLDDNPRVSDLVVDIGAYENQQQDLLFADGFDSME